MAIMFRPIASILAYTLLLVGTAAAQPISYPIVDTGQDQFYNDTRQITIPGESSPWYGQDALYQGNQPSFRDNGDGTITDRVTGLMWQQTPRLEQKYTFTEATGAVDTFSLAGYSDWRLPTIKELYSLIDFRGHTMAKIPFIDTSYFAFAYGDESAGERFIDAQYWSATQYVGLTMGGDATVFGVNFADGRIKGYPRDRGPQGSANRQFVRYVRGNSEYGQNRFVDNGDGTISDLATGLMWTKDDSQEGLNWEDALTYAEDLTAAGHDDWRLPNAKELQSLLDYTRAPDATEPSAVGPAIDPIFNISNISTEQDPEYPFYWTGTTHLDGPEPTYAAYCSFGRATGWMEMPPNSGQRQLLNVHGAGAQRSDPKDGDPGDYPYGHGPQGDVIRIFNHVRAVRTIEFTTGAQSFPEYSGLSLEQNYPNPFNPFTSIAFSVPMQMHVRLDVHDSIGRHVVTLVDWTVDAGRYITQWDASVVPAGQYYYTLNAGEYSETKSAQLIK